MLYNLVTKGVSYFLSRPRRFGKSMTVSTLKELFNGNKQLFENTWIYDKWKLYINKCIPEQLFKDTFTPKRFLFTDKTGKPRKIKHKIVLINSPISI